MLVLKRKTTGNRLRTNLGQSAAFFSVVEEEFARALLVVVEAVGSSVATIPLLHNRISATHLLVVIYLADVVLI